MERESRRTPRLLWAGTCAQPRPETPTLNATWALRIATAGSVQPWFPLLAVLNVLRGQGCEVNIKRAIAWLHKAVAGGDGAAAFTLYEMSRDREKLEADSKEQDEDEESGSSAAPAARSKHRFDLDPPWLYLDRAAANGHAEAIRLKQQATVRGVQQAKSRYVAGSSY